jgi:hypothetical protein
MGSLRDERACSQNAQGKRVPAYRAWKSEKHKSSAKGIPRQVATAATKLRAEELVTQAAVENGQWRRLDPQQGRLERWDGNWGMLSFCTNDKGREVQQGEHRQIGYRR